MLRKSIAVAVFIGISKLVLAVEPVEETPSFNPPLNAVETAERCEIIAETEDAVHFTFWVADDVDTGVPVEGSKRQFKNIGPRFKQRVIRVPKQQLARFAKLYQQPANPHGIDLSAHPVCSLLPAPPKLGVDFECYQEGDMIKLCQVVSPLEVGCPEECAKASTCAKKAGCCEGEVCCPAAGAAAAACKCLGEIASCCKTACSGCCEAPGSLAVAVNANRCEDCKCGDACCCSETAVCCPTCKCAEVSMQANTSKCQYDAASSHTFMLHEKLIELVKANAKLEAEREAYEKITEYREQLEEYYVESQTEIAQLQARLEVAEEREQLLEEVVELRLEHSKLQAIVEVTEQLRNHPRHPQGGHPVQHVGELPVHSLHRVSAENATLRAKVARMERELELLRSRVAGKHSDSVNVK